MPGPTKPHTHLSLSGELPVLGEAEGKTAEDTGDQRTACAHAGLICQPPLPASSKPCRATYSPELTLDLDPARAAQEGPGLVPLLHGGQAGAEYL